MFHVILIQQYKISEFFDAGKINNYGTKVKKKFFLVLYIKFMFWYITPHMTQPRF